MLSASLFHLNGIPVLEVFDEPKTFQQRSTASKSAFAQAWLTQYAASDAAVLDKAAKGHQSLARSPSLTCPEQMECHGDRHAQHANHCVAHHIKPMSSAVSSESGSFPENKKSVHRFSQRKTGPICSGIRRGCQSQIIQEFGSSPSRWNLRFLFSLAWCLLTSNGN